MRVLDKGRKNVEILKQLQYRPMKIEHMIAMVYCGTKELLRRVPMDKIRQFETEYIELLELQYKETLDSLRNGDLTDDIEQILRKTAAEVANRFF